MNDAAVADDPEVIEGDLVEQAEADTTEETEIKEGEVSEEQASTEDEPSESSTEKKDDGSNIQKRIDELTGKWREQERETEYWRQKAMEEPEAPKPLEADKTLEDFDYDTKAFTDYVMQLAVEQAKTEVSEETQRDQQARQAADFATKERTFSETVEDYQRVTRDPSLTMTQDMVEVIQSREKGPEILYYLGQNHDFARQLSQLSPIQMAAEIGMIEATKLVKPEPSPSNTPAPTPKITATETPTRISATEPESDSLSTKEWLKRREKQLRNK